MLLMRNIVKMAGEFCRMETGKICLLLKQCYFLLKFDAVSLWAFLSALLLAARQRQKSPYG